MADVSSLQTALGESDTPLVHTEHEFNAAETIFFKELAQAISLVGTVGFVFGLVDMATGLGGLLRQHVSVLGGGLEIGRGLLWVVLWVWVLDAGKSFRAIAETEGTDVPHLISAVRKLTRAFHFQTLILVFLLLALLVTLIPLIVGKTISWW